MPVTVAIPFYNNRTTILEAIRSVFAQTFNAWRLILLDDGSSDGSWELVSGIRDPRVTAIRDGHNRGLAYRLNEAAALTRTELLARMDADDIMHPRRIETQLTEFERDPSLDVVGSSAFSMTPDLRLIGLRLSRGAPTAGHVLVHGLFIHPTVMARTKWFRRNPYDVTLRRAQDHELWCRTFPTTRLTVIEEPLLYYREFAGSPNSYSASSKVNRALLRLYGPTWIGPVRSKVEIGRSYVKEATYRLGYRFRLPTLAARLRARRPDEALRTKAKEGLDCVRMTTIPGLEFTTGREGGQQA